MALKESKKRKQVYGDDNKEAIPKKRAHIMKTRSMIKYDSSIIKDLPQEVIMEIFSRLPWLSIMKLCLVFPSIMQRPDFESMYLQSPRRRSTSLFVASESYKNNPKGTKQVQIVEYHHSNHRIVSIKLDFTKLFREHENQSRSSVSKIVGCCNGLLLLSTTHDDHMVKSLHLVNPITRSSVKLPVSKNDHEKYGLGYSPNTRLYKVVDLNFDTNRNSVKVLTVDLNNAENNYCWRSCSVASKNNQLNCEKLSMLVMPYVGSPLPLHGAIHWLTEGPQRSQLFRFHIDDEEFDLVPLPYEDVYYRQLVALDGLICVLKSQVNKVGYTFFTTVWVMKEYGVKESWTQLTTMPLHTVVRNVFPKVNVLNVLENGKLLLRLGPLLRLYDPESKTWDEKEGKSRVRMNKKDDVITNFPPNLLYFTDRS